jgi:hypothetical protein
MGGIIVLHFCIRKDNLLRHSLMRIWQKVKIFLGLLLLLSILETTAYCEQNDSLFIPNGYNCEEFIASIAKITPVTILESYDTTIITKARAIACASFIANTHSLGPSDVYLNCILELNDLDSLLIIRFSIMNSDWLRLILYDPQSGYMNEPDEMSLTGLDLLILQHSNNPLYKEKLFLTRFYFMLQYTLDFRKFFSNEIDSLATTSRFFIENPDLAGSIKKIMIEGEKAPEVVDTEEQITIINTSIFSLHWDGAIIYKISAKFKGDYMENYKAKAYDVIGRKIP